MTLKYDIDFFSVFPDELFSAGETGDFLKDMGFQADQAQNKVAMFRDPNALAALQRAPRDVQKLMAEIGMGMNVYDSGAPAGQFPREDIPHRQVLLEKFRVASENPDVQSILTNPVPAGEFNLMEFLDYNIAATPARTRQMPQKKRRGGLKPMIKVVIEILLAIFVFLVIFTFFT